MPIFAFRIVENTYTIFITYKIKITYYYNNNLNNNNNNINNNNNNTNNIIIFFYLRKYIIDII